MIFYLITEPQILGDLSTTVKENWLIKD